MKLPIKWCIDVRPIIDGSPTKDFMNIGLWIKIQLTGNCVRNTHFDSKIFRYACFSLLNFPSNDVPMMISLRFMVRLQKIPQVTLFYQKGDNVALGFYFSRRSDIILIKYQPVMLQHFSGILYFHGGANERDSTNFHWNWTIFSGTGNSWKNNFCSKIFLQKLPVKLFLGIRPTHKFPSQGRMTCKLNSKHDIRQGILQGTTSVSYSMYIRHTISPKLISGS